MGRVRAGAQRHGAAPDHPDAVAPAAAAETKEERCPRSHSRSTSPSRWPTRRCRATTAGTRTSRPRRRCSPGSDFRVECREWTDAQIGNNDSANDVRDVEPRRARTCSAGRSRSRAPSRATCSWSTSSTSAPASRRRSTATRPARAGATRASSRKDNGGGFLTDHYPGLAQGDLGLPRPGRHLAPHPGRPLHGHHPPGPVRDRAVGRPAGRVEPARAGADRHRPGPRAAAGAAAARGAACWPATLTGDALAKVGREGARTVPARENGGNHDIKNFTRGSRVYYPVHVAGAQAVGRRPALLPGRRRDHVLRRDRDGRLHRLRRRPDQGRDEQVRGPHEPGVHAGPRGAALLGVPVVHRHLGRRGRATTTTWTPRSPTGARA